MPTYIACQIYISWKERNNFNRIARIGIEFYIYIYSPLIRESSIFNPSRISRIARDICDGIIVDHRFIEQRVNPTWNTRIFVQYSYK